MSKNFVVKAVSLAAMLSLLAGGVVFAQLDDPLATPPPNLFKGVKTAVVTSALTDPAAIEIIETVALEAHREISGKAKQFWTGTLPTIRSAAIAARDLAEEGFDIVLVNGGDSQSTVGSAGLFPNSVFVDLSQPPPCVTEDGRPDPSGTCAGGDAAIPFNYSAVTYAVDQAAYLAGIVAAGASRNNQLGIISGTPDCDECNTYIEGFTLGARSVKPNIAIELAYLSDDDAQAGFGPSTGGKIFAEAFINVFEPDVLFPLAGAGTVGMIEAACEAGIAAIGSEVDISASHPELAECVYTSVTKDLETAVRESIFRFANETLTRTWFLDLASGGVSATDEWRRVPGLPVDLPARYDEARQEIAIGLVDTCPTQCPERAKPAASPSPGPDTSPDPAEAPSDS